MKNNKTLRKLDKLCDILQGCIVWSTAVVICAWGLCVLIFDEYIEIITTFAFYCLFLIMAVTILLLILMLVLTLLTIFTIAVDKLKNK